MQFYRKSTWFEHYQARAAAAEALLCAGALAETLSYTVVAEFQEKPYTWVRITHVRDNVTYVASGFTFCDGIDIYDPVFGRTEAIKRARRKIAKRLVWERDLPQVLEAQKQKIKLVRGELFLLYRTRAQFAREHLEGAVVELP